MARKTPLRKPNRGEGIVSRKPRPKSACDFLGLLYCVIVLLCICVVSCPYVIYYPTVMVRYSLFVLKVPLNPKQTNKQNNCAADVCRAAEKWQLLEVFSRTAFYAGLCYMQAGDMRPAKSMLLHCLIFCEAFRLRKRFSSAYVCVSIEDTINVSTHLSHTGIDCSLSSTFLPARCVA